MAMVIAALASDAAIANCVQIDAATWSACYAQQHEGQMHEAELGSLTPPQVVPTMELTPTRNDVVVANVVVLVSSCFLTTSRIVFFSIFFDYYLLFNQELWCNFSSQVSSTQLQLTSSKTVGRGKGKARLMGFAWRSEV
jgi:hypothetical protein